MRQEIFWHNKNVFITGWHGFLGHALTMRLRKLGANVNGSSQAETFENYQKALTNVDVVFHIGARALVGQTKKDPLGTFQNNIQSTWNILEVCRQLNVQRIIVASSDKVYGEGLNRTEESPLQGHYPYEVSKICVDHLAQCYAKMYNVPIGITRCANLYGPGDMHISRLIPGTILSILKAEKPLIRSDGETLRAYLYIDDAVDAYLEFAQSNYVGALNFSGGQAYKTIDVVKKIMNIMCKEQSPIIKNEVKDEIREQSINDTKARTVLSWKSKVDLPEGLKRTAEAFKREING